MRANKVWRVMMVLALLATMPLLAGCRSRVLYTTHPQVLVERREGEYRQLDEDDPCYGQLADYLATDLSLARLLQAYEGATAAFAAADLHSPARVAVVNHAVIVLGADAGLLRDITVQGVYDKVQIEVALGAPLVDPVGLAAIAPELARAIGEALIFLANGEDGDDAVLRSGLGAALAARYLAETSEPYAGVRAVPESNAAVAAACALFQQLLTAPIAGYPQRYMLWFANFEPQDEALAKIVLVATRLPREATLGDFISAYATTFPGERARVMQLAAQIGRERE